MAEDFAVAIIGGGLSGVLVAAQLLAQATMPLTIAVIERDATLGQGVAYSTSQPTHLLNVRAENMSALPDQPAHFAEWLHTNALQPTAETAFVPRMHYAAYLRSLLAECAANARSGVTYTHLHASATDIIRMAGGLRITLDDGRTISAGHVVLALGNLPPADPLARVAGDCTRARVRSGYEASAAALASIGADDEIVLIGTGLTAVDVLLALQAQGHRGKLHAVSRHGLLPLAHQPRAPYPPYLAAHIPVTSARLLTHLVHREARRATAQGQDWRGVVDALRPITQQLWLDLPDAERQRFLRHVRTYWDIHRHRIAPEIAAVVHTLLASGQLRVSAGRIVAYHEDTAGAALTLRPRHSHTTHVLRADHVFNCTGPTGDYGATSDPFVTRLRGSGLLCADTLHQGIAADTAGRVLDATGEPSATISTLGPPLKGVVWECIAVPDIRIQARDLAARVLAGMTA